MLSTFGDHNPSRSELYNNGPLNLEKLLCGQYFYENEIKLICGWKTFRDSYDNFRFTILCIFVLLNLNQPKQFCEIFAVSFLDYWFFKKFLLINLHKVVFWRTQRDTPIQCPFCVLSVFNWLDFYGSRYLILRVKNTQFI